MGRGIGRLFYCFASERKHIARTNLRLCFPELSGEKREALLKQNMQDTGMGLMEQNIGWFMPERRYRKLMHVEGLAHIEALGEQAALIVVKHNNCISVCTIGLSMFMPIAGMYRRHKNAALEYLQTRGRVRLCPEGTVVERKETRTMMRLLRQGLSVMYAPDQDYGIKNGVWARYFDLPAATVAATTGFAKLGRAKVVVMNCYRLPNAEGYKIILSAPLDNVPSDDERQDAQCINDIFEAQIREYPEQYLWVHRRFKTRPAGEKRPY
ncbi:lipid A biosynthesis lauroyl acyltransferase [Simiduia litorea]